MKLRVRRSLRVIENEMSSPSTTCSSSSSVDFLPERVTGLLDIPDFFQDLLYYLDSSVLCTLNCVSRYHRSVIQSFVRSNNMLLHLSGSFQVAASNEIPLPSERMDIWFDPTDAPERLPQSLLHGRCGAHLILANGRKQHLLKTSKHHVYHEEGEGEEEKEEEQPYSLFSQEHCNPNSPHLYICGGYGMFELFDVHIPLRTGEVWAVDLDSHNWYHPVPMTEEMLSNEPSVRYDERGVFVLQSSKVLQICVFGQTETKYPNSCHSSFHRVSLMYAKKGTTEFECSLQFPPPEIFHFPAKGPLPSRREFFSSTMMTPPTASTNGLMLLFGGCSSRHKALDDLFVFEIPADLTVQDFTWHSVEQNKGKFRRASDSCWPCPRFGHSLTKVGPGRGIMFGGKKGIGESHALLDDVAELTFDGRTFRWTNRECHGKGPTKRMSHRAAAIGCHLIIFGGFSRRYMNDLYSLNLGFFCWTEINLCPRLSRGISCKRKLENGKPIIDNNPVKEYVPLRARMEPALLFDGVDTLYIFGGIVRYRWDHRSLKFSDYLNDILALKLKPDINEGNNNE